MNEIQKILDTFQDGNGFGDPEARQNAAMRLQVLLVKENQQIAARLNWLTFILIILGILQLFVLVFQILGNKLF